MIGIRCTLSETAGDDWGSVHAICDGGLRHTALHVAVVSAGRAAQTAAAQGTRSAFLAR